MGIHGHPIGKANSIGRPTGRSTTCDTWMIHLDHGHHGPGQTFGARLISQAEVHTEFSPCFPDQGDQVATQLLEMAHL